MRHDRRLLIAILQLCMGGVIVAIVSAIAPNFVLEFFHQPQTHMVLVLFPAGVGLVLGSAFTPALINSIRYVRTIMIGIIALATSIALLDLAARHCSGNPSPTKCPGRKLGDTVVPGSGHLLDLLHRRLAELRQCSYPDDHAGPFAGPNQGTSTGAPEHDAKRPECRGASRHRYHGGYPGHTGSPGPSGGDDTDCWTGQHLLQHTRSAPQVGDGRHSSHGPGESTTSRVIPSAASAGTPKSMDFAEDLPQDEVIHGQIWAKFYAFGKMTK